MDKALPDGETRRLPLLMVVGASNRLPEDDALGALFDRFLLRVRSENVGDDRLAGPARQPALPRGAQAQRIDVEIRQAKAAIKRASHHAAKPALKHGAHPESH